MDICSQEDFVKKAREKAENFGKDLDDELDQMMKNDPDLKNIKKDSLDELEKEDKHLSDDELNDLEKSMENEGKPKAEEKSIKKIQTEVKEEVKPSHINLSKEDEKKKDIYLWSVENIFHKPDKYQSMGVIQAENDVIDKIIEFKKANKFDFSQFETKKLLVSAQESKITNLVEQGIITLDKYKELIEAQRKY